MRPSSIGSSEMVDKTGEVVEDLYFDINPNHND